MEWRGTENVSDAVEEAVKGDKVFVVVIEGEVFIASHNYNASGPPPVHIQGDKYTLGLFFVDIELVHKFVA